MKAEATQVGAELVRVHFLVAEWVVSLKGKDPSRREPQEGNESKGIKHFLYKTPKE